MYLALLLALTLAGCGGGKQIICSASVVGPVSLAMALYTDQNGDNCVYFNDDIHLTGIWMFSPKGSVVATVDNLQQYGSIEVKVVGGASCKDKLASYVRQESQGIVTETLTGACGEAHFKFPLIVADGG